MFGTSGAIWSLILVVILVACIMVTAIWAMYDMEHIVPLFGGLLAVAVVLGIWVIAMWPLKHDYHNWVTKSGKVQSISNRIVSDGDSGISQRFVVVLHGTQYGIDDTRASLLKVGDTVTLRCKKEHQFMQPYGSDGWGCRWGGITN